MAATLLPPRPGEDTSLSGQDYRVARSLARQGVSPVDIAEAIRRGSPGLGVSRHKDVKDYLARTVSRALNVGLTG